MERPYDAKTLRDRIHQFASDPKAVLLSPGMHGAILGGINKVLASDGDMKAAEAKRHTVLGWLFGDISKPLKPMSSKSLTDSQWYALSRWIDLMRTTDGKWYPNEFFTTELLWVLAEALKKERQDEGQLMLALGFDAEESDG